MTGMTTHQKMDIREVGVPSTFQGRTTGGRSTTSQAIPNLEMIGHNIMNKTILNRLGIQLLCLHMKLGAVHTNLGDKMGTEATLMKNAAMSFMRTNLLKGETLVGVEIKGGNAEDTSSKVTQGGAPDERGRSGMKVADGTNLHLTESDIKMISKTVHGSLVPLGNGQTESNSPNARMAIGTIISIQRVERDSPRTSKRGTGEMMTEI